MLLGRAVEWIRASRQPLIVAGGGVIYSEATEVLARFCEQTGIPVGETQAGKGSLRFDHAQNLGAIGATGTPAAYPATCTSSGTPGTPRATTWSTATRPWATRSPVGWG